MPLNTACDNEAFQKTAELLKNADRILILTHKSPDGDTVGSAFALCRALLKLSKKARVECSDPLPVKFEYMFGGLQTEDFCPDLIVASDIAAESLFGDGLKNYEGRVGLCIDHHPSNSGYAEFTLLDPCAAATCELMAEVIELLNVEYDENIADCIYTGLATDTGCFRYSNTTAKTLRTAAAMVDRGARNSKINKALFETLSRGRIEIERMALGAMEFYFDGRAAVMAITREMYDSSGCGDSETEGLPAITTRIAGVLAGVTIKEKEAGQYKISVRTNGGINASDICARFGGGGHAAAAGCQLDGSLEDAKNAILNAVGCALSEIKKDEQNP
jgi:phosphoesterase RecJ-like protein